MAKTLKAVALGGGHGLSATLRALRFISEDVTAIVTVADDGGSSGRLRSEFDILPPGDLRMALAALCEGTEWGRTWRDLLQYRFQSDGPLAGHAVGNLLIAALWQQRGNEVHALDLVGRLLGAGGRVLPMCVTPLVIEADVTHDGERRTVSGQVSVATVPGSLDNVRLSPPNPAPCREALQALDGADLIVLGPGSWYTSVLPHLLVPDLAAAIRESAATRVIVMNLAAQDSETAELSPADHLHVLLDHDPQLRCDVVIADPLAVQDPDRLVCAAHDLGGQVLFRQVRSADHPAIHDPLRLAAAIRDGYEGAIGDLPR
ncbi:MAG: uridine diphosphate-N-acetylglucosamine-binding protein YvcK [Bowdeniella nasicola]|nr:uridine diphosphate-N-acetylglucosamine-binding protein YvcK [Bowdeniella nasicola]